jgi:hypothetical protein
MTEILVALTAAIGVVSGIVTIAGGMTLLRPFTRPKQIAIGAVLLLIGIGAGVASLPREPDAPAAMPTHQQSAVLPAAPEPKPAPPTVVTGPAIKREAMIVDDQQQPVDELTAVARKASGAKRSIEGRLRTSVGAPDPSLQDLITATVTLNVTITDRAGNVTNAFELITRGGGFTADAATHQARERMKTALSERLEQEQP